jgi:hypothetical protein
MPTMEDVAITAQPKFCNRCGFYINGLSDVKGTFVMEVLLWLLFFPIGIIYSVWRLTGRKYNCPKCGIPIPR